MDGQSLRMYRASRMDNRYGSLLVQMILVLLTRDSRVRLILWEFWVCCFGPPLLRCMVSRRERVVVGHPVVRSHPEDDPCRSRNVGLLLLILLYFLLHTFLELNKAPGFLDGFY